MQRNLLKRRKESNTHVFSNKAKAYRRLSQICKIWFKYKRQKIKSPCLHVRRPTSFICSFQKSLHVVDEITSKFRHCLSPSKYLGKWRLVWKRLDGNEKTVFCSHDNENPKCLRSEIKNTSFANKSIANSPCKTGLPFSIDGV